MDSGVGLTGLTDEDAYNWLLLNSDKLSSHMGGSDPTAVPHPSSLLGTAVVPAAGPSNAMLSLPPPSISGVPSDIAMQSGISGGSAAMGVGVGVGAVGGMHALADGGCGAGIGAELSVFGQSGTGGAGATGGDDSESDQIHVKHESSGSASDSSSTPANATTRTEKKRLRLERNRECARECRRRKRDHTSELEARVAALEAQNTHLQLQLKAGREGRALEEQKKDGIVDELKSMVENGGPEGKIQAKIKEFGARHADYGTDRRSAVRWHLEQAELLLVPTQVTKMALWTVQQDDAFYEEREDDSLSKILFRELQLTDNQKDKIRSHRCAPAPPPSSPLAVLMQPSQPPPLPSRAAVRSLQGAHPRARRRAAPVAAERTVATRAGERAPRSSIPTARLLR